MRTLSRLILSLTVFLPPALWAQSTLATEWFGAGGDQGVHYLGSSQTTGSTTPSIGNQTETGTPKGWSNPAPDGTPPRSTTPARSDPAPLTVPPGSR
jgi:hypothetical protein